MGVPREKILPSVGAKLSKLPGTAFPFPVPSGPAAEEESRLRVILRDSAGAQCPALVATESQPQLLYSACFVLKDSLFASRYLALASFLFSCNSALA